MKFSKYTLPKFPLRFVIVLLLVGLVSAGTTSASTTNQVRGNDCGIGGPSGGSKGTPVGYTCWTSNLKVYQVRIRTGRFVNSIQLVYKEVLSNGQCSTSTREGQIVGGNEGQLQVFELACDEHIISVAGRYGSNVDWIQIKTNKRRGIEAGGTGGPAFFYYVAPLGHVIVDFWGRASTVIDAIGVVYQPRSWNW